MKDRFSEQSDAYLQFRPSIPSEVFDFIFKLLPDMDRAWDCGTGNGQVARHLAEVFKSVEATDISQSQLDKAYRYPNIRYSRQPAENTDFPDQTFDLITVSQAIHWFDFEQFYKEVKRTGKKGGILAVMGYGLLSIHPEIDQIIQLLYSETLKGHWDPERKYIDENYLTIPFPFPEIDSPQFKQTLNWSLTQLVGYLETWSAVKNYQRHTGKQALYLIKQDLRDSWGKEEVKSVTFPILLRVGRL
ncbi:class I SAM-dependent methyltransferase [Pararhodonellum marinum]|uniref:class I SAM-dependent methyltransferase n=1 Tax=Pararhodonellum marinum TaxID=2755358 RepID=UPI00188EF121|nr:class I SAM-dependent methyltransferase [Pararhodonellum marinum]